MKSIGTVLIECDGPSALEEEMLRFSASLINERAALCVVGIDSCLMTEAALLELVPPEAARSS